MLYIYYSIARESVCYTITIDFCLTICIFFNNLYCLYHMIDRKYVSGYHKALVIGTGDGNDIVSAIPVAVQLQEYWLQTDIAGVLSWAAFHSYEWSPELPINRVVWNTQRFISHPAKKEVSFVDPHLLSAVDDLAIPIDNFYNFSTRFGTEKLTDWLRSLIADKQYDLLVAVDVGWDILARWAIDSHVLSPMMDWSMLRVLADVDTDSLLIEFGLGTDGELRPSSIDAIIAELQESNIIMDRQHLDKDSLAIQKFQQVFDTIKTIRTGNTNVQTLATLDAMGTDKNLSIPYRFRTQLHDKKWFTWFDVELLHKYFGQSFTMDLQALASKRIETAISYENLLEQYIKIKAMQPQRKTECDLFCLWSGENFTTTDQYWYCLQFTCPSYMIAPKDRAEILSTSVRSLYDGDVDVLLCFTDDIRAMDIPDWAHAYRVNDIYSLIYYQLDYADINSLQHKIVGYMD